MCPTIELPVVAVHGTDEADAPTCGFNFRLDDEQWDDLQRMLNEPPKDKPRLRRLLAESGACG